MGSIQSSSPLSSPFQVGGTDSKGQIKTSMKTGGESLSKLNNLPDILVHAQGGNLGVHHTTSSTED